MNKRFEQVDWDNSPEEDKEEWSYPVVSEGTFEKHYMIGNVISEGSLYKQSYTEICTVQKKDYRRPLAVKMIDKHIYKKNTKDAEFTKLYREVDNLRALRSPFIIRFIECFNEENALYIITEYVRAPTLRKLIQMDEIGEEYDISCYIYQVLQALRHCHGRGVVHHDIKPSNILITKDCYNQHLVKLIDFGLGYKENKHGSPYYEFGGTLHYASPQVLKHLPHTSKNDLWSVGVVLFECLTHGVKPFGHNFPIGSERQIDAIANNIAYATLEFKQKQWETISDYAKVLVVKLLEKEEKDRYSAEEALRNDWFHSFRKTTTETVESKINSRLATTARCHEAAEIFGNLMKSEKVRVVDYDL